MRRLFVIADDAHDILIHVVMSEVAVRFVNENSAQTDKPRQNSASFAVQARAKVDLEDGFSCSRAVPHSLS